MKYTIVTGQCVGAGLAQAEGAHPGGPHGAAGLPRQHLLHRCHVPCVPQKNIVSISEYIVHATFTGFTFHSCLDCSV